MRVRTAGFEMCSAIEFWLLSLMVMMAAFFGIIYTYDSRPDPTMRDVPCALSSCVPMKLAPVKLKNPPPTRDIIAVLRCRCSSLQHSIWEGNRGILVLHTKPRDIIRLTRAKKARGLEERLAAVFVLLFKLHDLWLVECHARSFYEPISYVN